MAALDLGLVGNIKTCVFTAVTSQIYFKVYWHDHDQEQCCQGTVGSKLSNEVML